MERSKTDIKGHYKQKKPVGISKPKSSSAAKRNSSPPKHSATCGSNIVQPAAPISHGSVDLQDDYDENEKKLRQFDMNIAYGPCIGMTRLDRWERANKLGMNPPEEITELLKSKKVKDESLWGGRI